MPTHVQGRRVEDIEAIERGGDYVVKYAEDGRIAAVWFAMPGFPDHLWNRVRGKAAPAKEEPRWEISEDADGRVTISPSIRSWWTWGEAEEKQQFHAFLKAGVWEVLDDSVGATFD